MMMADIFKYEKLTPSPIDYLGLGLGDENIFMATANDRATPKINRLGEFYKHEKFLPSVTPSAPTISQGAVELGKELSPTPENTKKSRETMGNQIQVQFQEKLQLWKRHTSIYSKDHPAVRNLAAEICTILVKTKSFEQLSHFIQAIPDTRDYRVCESIIRARVHVALYKKDTKKVYELLQENHFVDGEDLIKVWDEALYIDEERRTKKKLTPLSRFRARKRYPPPKSICSEGIRKTNTLPKEATNHLRAWLMSHIDDPYPSASENIQLAKLSKLTQAQVKTWFANARRRNKNSEEFQRKLKPSSECSSVVSSPISPTSQLPLLPPNPHPSPYFFYNEDPLSHISHNTFETSQTAASACCEYYQCYMSGYNRHLCGGNTSPYAIGPAFGGNVSGGCTWRTGDQDYDFTTGRSLLDLPSKGHHYEYQPSHFYF